MAKDFEIYAETHYLPAVNDREAAELNLLAGLRFVETRTISDHEKRLREIFTTRRGSKLGREIDDACLGALLATSDNAVATAGFLSLVATMPRPLPTSRLAEKSVRLLGRDGKEGLFRELARSHTGQHLRGLARLLMRISRVPPPEPIGFWENADQAKRQEAVDRWKEKISKSGGL